MASLGGGAADSKLVKLEARRLKQLQRAAIAAAAVPTSRVKRELTSAMDEDEDIDVGDVADTGDAAAVAGASSGGDDADAEADDVDVEGDAEDAAAALRLKASATVSAASGAHADADEDEDDGTVPTHEAAGRAPGADEAERLTRTLFVGNVPVDALKKVRLSPPPPLFAGGAQSSRTCTQDGP